MKFQKIKIESALYFLAALIVTVTIVNMYLNMRTWIPQVQGDVFYDADSIRTLNYLSDFWSALSFIRPTLVFVALLLFPLALVFTTYITWTLLTIFSFCLMLYSLIQLYNLQRLFENKKLFIAVAANFSAVAFLFVPDTFVMSTALFFFGIVVLEKRQSAPFIMAGFLISCGTNLFFAIPWAVYYFLRKYSSQPIKRFALGVIVPLVSLLGLQWGLRKLAPSPAVSSIVNDPSIGSLGVSSEPSGTGLQSFLSSSDALKWLHSPFDNFLMNFLGYLDAPWTVNYRYEIGHLPDATSSLPIWIILCGISLTLLSFKGLWDSRRKHKNLVTLIWITEVSCLLLFLTYGAHPYLFSPFLIATRAVGISMSRLRPSWLGVLIIACLPILNLLTQAYVFN